MTAHFPRDFDRSVPNAQELQSERGVIIIPAYNEASNLAGVLREVISCKGDLDVLVIDDGSRDDTTAIARQFPCSILIHPVNLGYAAAVQTGLKYASSRGYDYGIFLDADGQHNPHDIPRLVATQKRTGAHVVVGSRYLNGKRDRTPFGRWLGIRFFSSLTTRLTGHQTTDTTSGFKLLTRDAMKAIVEESFGDFHSETLIYLLLRRYIVVEEPVMVRPRVHGNSMYTIWDIWYYPMKTLLAIMVVLLKLRWIRRKGGT